MKTCPQPTVQLLGVLLVIISATSFGAMPIFAHFAYAAGVTPLTALFFRFAIAAFCLCTYLALRKIPLPRPQNLRTLILVGGVGFVLQSLSFFTALTLASPGLVVLLLYLYPTLVVGLSILVLHRPTSPTKLTALGVALLGTVLTIGPVGETQLPGVILGLLSASIYAIYVLIGEQVMQEESPLTSCTVMISSAAIVYGGIISIHGINLPIQYSGWFAILALAMVSTILALSTFFAGIKFLGASTASMLSTVEPVITIVLSMMILQQSITKLQIVGGALILTAVVILTLGKSINQPLKAGYE
jgi:drug/metabolite transporter (DMT)-like permease